MLQAALGHLVITDELFNAIGPAIVSGQSVFIYGPPGNGKTSIAQAIGDFMNQCRRRDLRPLRLPGREQHHHRLRPGGAPAGRRRRRRPLEDNEATIRRLLNTGTVDPRWVRIRRPVIITGGELNLTMLDLRYNAEANFYQAPLHVKANGGIFLIDDFGRQLCSPKELLNRWILPLEDRHRLSVTVVRQEVPGSLRAADRSSRPTSIRSDLVDDAFLRRIRHKVEITAPTRDIYEQHLQRLSPASWA